MNGQASIIVRWAAVVLAGMGLAYGYGALNNRVDWLERRASDNQAIVISLAELSARLGVLEKEVARLAAVLERSQAGATYPGAPRPN